MHELAAVWTDRNGRTWIAVTAFLYVLVLVPFNYINTSLYGMQLRPAAFLPIALGILFGPAAAWGTGIGNVVGDFFGGSWSPMSIFGALVNFLLPWLSYRIFHHLMRDRPIGRDFLTLGCFLAISLFVTVACMVLLASSGTLFFNRPFGSKLVSYIGNNIFWAMVVGPLFFWLLADTALKNNLVYGREWELREKKPADPE